MCISSSLRAPHKTKFPPIHKRQRREKYINMNTNSIMLYLFKNLVAYLRVKCAEYNQGESSKTATEICFRICLRKMSMCCVVFEWQTEASMRARK